MENLKSQLLEIDELYQKLRQQIIGAIHDFVILHPDYEPDQGESKIPVYIPLKDENAFDDVRVINGIEVLEETGEFCFVINGDEIYDQELTLEELQKVLKGLSKLQ